MHTLAILFPTDESVKETIQTSPPKGISSQRRDERVALLYGVLFRIIF